MAAGQTVQFQNLAQNMPNYATQSQAIGAAVEEAYDERQKRIEDARAAEEHEADQLRKAQLHEMQDMQLAQMKQSQYESLNVPANTGIVSADQYINKASRNLVDMQANLVNQLKKGEIDTDQFAQQSAIIKNQVPALKNANETLGNFQKEYADLLSAGKISDADDGQAAQLYNAIQNGGINIEAAEDGSLMMVGDGISVPLSQINRIPKPMPKAQSLVELSQGPLAAIGDGPFNPEEVHKALDNVFTNDDVANEKLLKSIAVDSMNMPLSRAVELLNTPVDSDTGATNALEQAVEQSLYNTVKTQYDAKQLELQKAQQAEAYKEAQINAMNRQVNNPKGLTPNQQARTNTINGIAENYTKNYNQLQSLFTTDAEGNSIPKGEDSINAINQVLKNFGGHNIDEIVYEPGGEVGGSSWYNPMSWGDKATYQPGEFLIYRKGAKSPTPATYEELLQVVGRTQFGLDSPFKASRGARKAAQNEKTKAAHAQRTSDQWDERRDDTKTYGDLALSVAKAIPGAALIGTAGSVISDAAGAAQGKGIAKVRNKAITGAAKLAGAGAKEAAKAAGGIGLALAAKDIADTFNKVQYQGMTPEEQQKRRTITASQRRGGK